MLRNYLTTAFRNLLRQKGSTVLNIAGLTLGITCSLVLFLLVRHLYSYDQYHSKLERIYRIVTQSESSSGTTFHTAGVPTVLPDAFRNDFPEAEEVMYVSYRAGQLVTIPADGQQPKRFTEASGVTFAEPNFFKIFDRKVLQGDALKGLDEPNEAVISVSLAKKYFDTDDAIGKLLQVDTMEYKVTAIMEDAPSNTDLPFNLMLSYATIEKSREENNWQSIWSDEQCYILLKENHTAADIEARMPAFVNKYLVENYNKQTFKLQPLGEMHFDQDYSTLSYSTVSKDILVALSAVAIFLILTACINFINLTTAEAIKRSKEVGIRKTLGSSRAQLISQFLGETAMVTMLAMLVSLGAAQLLLGLVNAFLETSLSLDFSNDVALWIFIAGVTLTVSLLSGLYPSFVISGYRPALALKNQINNRSSSGYHLRRGLVVLQFVISQFFIIGTIVLISQVNYFEKKDLGFNKEAVIVFPIPENEIPYQSSSKMKALRDDLTGFSGVIGASLSNAPPASGAVNGTRFTFEGEDASKSKDTQIKQVDGSYLELFDIKLIAGEPLTDGDTATGFLVNEQLLKVSGINTPEEALGKKMQVWGRTRPIVGVVKDFHTVSLQSRIEPTVLFNRIRGFSNLSVKVQPGQYQAVIDYVKPRWEAAYPEYLFSYEFLDEQINQFYRNEQRMSTLFTMFTSIAILIGCLGLFGLATFMANQKTKEVGVRKVLGASVESIVFMFSREYIKLVIISFAIAAPLGWYVMNRWLDQFAYKITIGPMIFVMGLVSATLISLLTVGYKSVKAAIANPVNSLKYE